MIRGIVRSLLFVGLLAGAMLVTSQAQAGWGHLRGYAAAPYVGWTGYSYSYYGGYYGGLSGCCGPTYTAYVPTYVPTYAYCDPCYTPSCFRGCGLLSNLFYRCRTHHYGYYWGGCNTCGLVSGCDCGYGNSWIDAGGGTIQYSTPADGSIPGDIMSPTPAEPPAAEPGAELPESQTSVIRGSAMLTVNVPDNARVMVNGVATRSTGDVRRYVSRNLMAGFDYTYEVKAEVMVDGKPVVQTKTVQLRAGQQAELAFGTPAATSLETALTLHVPANAKVFLAGNQTNGTGSVRTFRTTKLSDGQAWNDYVVRVVVNENGMNNTKEETITLRAGDQRELTFDFEIDKVASVR